MVIIYVNDQSQLETTRCLCKNGGTSSIDICLGPIAPIADSARCVDVSFFFLLFFVPSFVIFLSFFSIPPVTIITVAYVM